MYIDMQTTWKMGKRENGEKREIEKDK